MASYVVARLLAIVPTMAVLLLAVVILVRLLPGDAVDILLAEQTQSTPEQRADIEERLGLDKSIFEEYVSYSLGAFRGDLGDSLWSDESVTDIIGGRVGVTIELGLMAFVFGTVTGVAVGVLSAVKQNSIIDYVMRSVSILGLSIPNFALASVLIVLPAIWWSWTPPLIYSPLSDGLWDHLYQFFWPAVILGMALSATLMRVTRTMMLEVLRMDYVRTARSKGLGSRVVITRHALRNALIPVVSLIGVQVAFLLSGTIIVEQVFGLPGMGQRLVAALTSRDYPLIQGFTLVTGLMVIVINLAVDLSYGIIDPRTRGS